MDRGKRYNKLTYNDDFNSNITIPSVQQKLVLVSTVSIKSKLTICAISNTILGTVSVMSVDYTCSFLLHYVTGGMQQKCTYRSM